MGLKATCRQDLGGYKDGLGFKGLRLEFKVYIIGLGVQGLGFEGFRVYS